MRCWQNIRRCVKESLFASLVLSRLLFNAHIVVPTLPYLKILNAVYMRVVRRTANRCRFEKTQSDLQVRVMLKLPSIECVLMRARLRYLKRVLKTAPRALVAILQLKHKTKQMKWVALIIEDMKILRARISAFSKMPDPSVEASTWHRFILASPKAWAEAVAMLHFSESRFGQVEQPIALTIAVVHTFACDKCGTVFASSRALQSHVRLKHKERCLQRLYADSSGVCSVCKTILNTRLRLIAHLSDTRRDECWSEIRAHPRKYKRLAAELVADLDDKDRVSRRDVQRQGKSHRTAVGSARTASGKLIGHVRS